MEKRRIYLREWRKKSGLTQKQVADWLSSLDDPLLPQTEASLSRIETQQQPYSQRILEAPAATIAASGMLGGLFLLKLRLL